MPNYQRGKGKTIPIKDFAPDLESTAYDGWGLILDMVNAVPSMAGYRSRPSPVQYAPALPEIPLGGYVALYKNGALSVVAGGKNHLYRLSGGAWTVADTVNSFNATQRWRFAQFNDDLIAVNGSVAAAQVASGPGALFSNLGGNPPNNFLTAISVGGVLVGYVGAAWANSAAGTDNNWTPNVQTQAATGTLYDYPGSIVGATPFFRQQIVFKQGSMYILLFVGADTIWNNQLASNATGTWGQECIAQWPEAVGFIGNDDFWITQGYAPTRIQNNVKEWFFRNVYRDQNNNPIYLPNSWSWYDPENAVAYWHWVSKTAPYPGVCDRITSYNVRAQRWGTDHLNTLCVIPNTQPGLTSGLYFDMNRVLQTWKGPPQTMGLLTGFLGDQSALTQMMCARATYSDQLYPSSDQITPLSTYILGKSATVLPPGMKGPDDFFYYRDYNRFHQIHLVTVGDTEITGFSGEYRVGGNR